MPRPHPLRAVDRPEFEAGGGALRVADLFSGCGGLTLGAAQAAHRHGRALEIPIALDVDDSALAVYQANFPKSCAQLGTVESYFDGDLGCPNTSRENELLSRAGDVDLLVAGPPCQGHSDLNNHTRRNDPKNALYLRAARAAEVLRPRCVLIENVPAVRHDRGGVVEKTSSALHAAGYTVAEGVVPLHELGVPQRRRRHILIAVSGSQVPPTDWLDRLRNHAGRNHDLTWAIGDLHGLLDRRGIDTIPRASVDNLRRMQFLLQSNTYDLPNTMRPICHRGDHSYKSMYGRLRWDEPAQTITTGFGSIGQGRYMHPAEPRALTAHEAARIQGFPDYFDFSPVERRTALAEMIGNAVPPMLSEAVTSLLLTDGLM